MCTLCTSEWCRYQNHTITTTGWPLYQSNVMASSSVTLSAMLRPALALMENKTKQQMLHLLTHFSLLSTQGFAATLLMTRNRVNCISKYISSWNNSLSSERLNLYTQDLNPQNIFLNQCVTSQQSILIPSITAYYQISWGLSHRWPLFLFTLLWVWSGSQAETLIGWWLE